MKCNLKSMLCLTAVILAIAYVVSAQAMAVVLVTAPILLASICPVTMIAMMLAMRGHGANAPKTPPTVEAQTFDSATAGIVSKA